MRGRFRFRVYDFHSRHFKMRAVRSIGSGCAPVLLLGLLLTVGSVYAAARAADFAAPASPCPGRVAIIEAVEHPIDYAGDRDQRTAWAIHTQQQVDACADAGIIGRPYAYYMALKIDARIVRYLRDTSSDPDEARRALAAFDRLYIESRPALIGTMFASFAGALRDDLHENF